jgi:hypothetical protein
MVVADKIGTQIKRLFNVVERITVQQLNTKNGRNHPSVLYFIPYVYNVSVEKEGGQWP